MSEKKSVTRLDSTYMDQYEAHVERQRRKKKRLFRRLALFGLLMLIITSSLAVYHVQQRMVYAEKEAEYEQLQEEMASLEDKESDLKEEKELLQQEEYVLEIARSNYFFSKEGEIIFKIPNEEPSY
ncbi:cell division protein [Salimicrobium jeotgali]|uniref:Cell division protein n=1 Tax=Salimicrobium jeotgali TaxID=1230341 RepID=K2H544_9BACI|nr:septum formation initiator family protein [Salimicrobium jeotgali]AKG03258.1 cell division protein [Salimicrobium jeotgali]EKE30995.1 cell-division initiation protein [Salimicrobium jeotgali]MBM7697494.1 cell division protein DivIC [Salimicrobium jeotgali]